MTRRQSLIFTLAWIALLAACLLLVYSEAHR